MQRLLDGKKNAVLQFDGELHRAVRQPLFTIDKLNGSPTTVRVEAILYSLEEKVNLFLDDIVIPLAGRGKLDFEQFHPLTINLTVGIEGVGRYFLMLDLEKI